MPPPICDSQREGIGISTPNSVNGVVVKHLLKFELLNSAEKRLRLLVQVVHHALEHSPLVVPGMHSVIFGIIQVRGPVGKAFIKIFVHWGQVACILKVIENVMK